MIIFCRNGHFNVSFSLMLWFLLPFVPNRLQRLWRSTMKGCRLICHTVRLFILVHRRFLSLCATKMLRKLFNGMLWHILSSSKKNKKMQLQPFEWCNFCNISIEFFIPDHVKSVLFISPKTTNHISSVDFKICTEWDTFWFGAEKTHPKNFLTEDKNGRLIWTNFKYKIHFTGTINEAICSSPVHSVFGLRTLRKQTAAIDANIWCWHMI